MVGVKPTGKRRVDPPANKSIAEPEADATVGWVEEEEEEEDQRLLRLPLLPFCSIPRASDAPTTRTRSAPPAAATDCLDSPHAGCLNIDTDSLPANQGPRRGLASEVGVQSATSGGRG